MNLFDCLQIAMRAIRSNPLRSALTSLGVIIGVASVVALVALGQGAGVQISKQIQGLGTNLIIIATQIPPNGGTQNPNNLGGPPQLFPDDADVLKDALGDGAIVIPVQNAQTPLKIGSKVVNANVVGTWPVYADARGLQITEVDSFVPEARTVPATRSCSGPMSRIACSDGSARLGAMC